MWIVMLTAATTRAWAVSSPGMQRLSLDVGAAFPTGVNDFSTSARMGPQVGAQYLYEIDENFDVGLQADYFHFGSKDYTLTNNGTGGQLNARSQDTAATVEIMGRYNLLQDAAQFAPYLHSGVGMAYFRQKSSGEPLPGSTWTDTGTGETRQLQDDSSLGFAFSFGAGVDTKLSDNLILGLETAWHIFGVSKTTYGTTAIGVPTVSLRLGWRFGPDANKTPKYTGLEEGPDNPTHRTALQKIVDSMDRLASGVTGRF